MRPDHPEERRKSREEVHKKAEEHIKNREENIRQDITDLKIKKEMAFEENQTDLIDSLERRIFDAEKELEKLALFD